MAHSLDNTNMLAEARNAQWSADTFLGPGSVRVLAPAKVNLFLGIGERLPNGYHIATNVMHALALHDVVWVNCESAPDAAAAGFGEDAESDAVALGGPAQNLRVSITMADKTGENRAPLEVPANKNLVFKAIDALARKLGYVQFERISIHIEKNVPAEGGLGGGSSDAAATLVAAAHFWGLPTDDPTLTNVAMSIGADVAFFLKGGCALLTGVGEKFERELEPWKLPLVLVKPVAGVSTAAAYSEFDSDLAPIPAELVARTDNAFAAAEVPLFNNLAQAAEKLCPELAEVHSWLNACEGVESVDSQEPSVLLCGSGATTFAICDSFASASKIAGDAQARGWWARATTFSRLRAAIAPSKGGPA